MLFKRLAQRQKRHIQLWLCYSLSLSKKGNCHSLWRSCGISTNLLKGKSDNFYMKAAAAAALLLFPKKDHQDVLCTFTEDRLVFCRVCCCIHGFFCFFFDCHLHCHVVTTWHFMLSSSCASLPVHQMAAVTNLPSPHTSSAYIKAQRQWVVDHMPANVTVLVYSYLCVFIIIYDIHNQKGITFTSGHYMA